MAMGTKKELRKHTSNTRQEHEDIRARYGSLMGEIRRMKVRRNQGQLKSQG